jgi:hypothetical protein
MLAQVAPDPALPGTGPQAQDPLAQLQDIHLPPEIGLWPPAWGWWFLAALAIALLSTLVFVVRRQRRRNRYRQQALAELRELNRSGPEQNGEWLQALSILLRRTAIAGCGPQFDTGLKAEAWLQWLDERCPACKQQFSQGAGTALLVGPYQKHPDCDRTALSQLAQTWIRQHRNQWQKAGKKKADTAKNGGQHV